MAKVNLKKSNLRVEKPETLLWPNNEGQRKQRCHIVSMYLSKDTVKMMLYFGSLTPQTHGPSVT